MKTAHTLAQEYGCVYVEDLKMRNMTKSAKGTLDNPGKNVKQKSGLNRAILRTGFLVCGKRLNGSNTKPEAM